MKTCSKCKTIQPLNEFHKSCSHKDGVNPQCRTCFNKKRRDTNREDKKDLERAKKWYTSNKEKVRSKQIERKYGITYENYLLLIEDQNNKCAICCKIMNGKREPAIDHCHDTGQVRQLLCSNCNAAIGLLQDDPIIIEKAAQYVSRHRKNNLKVVS